MSETADNNDNPATADDTEGVSPANADNVNNKNERRTETEREPRKREVFRRAASNLTASDVSNEDK